MLNCAHILVEGNNLLVNVFLIKCSRTNMNSITKFDFGNGFHTVMFGVIKNYILLTNLRFFQKITLFVVFF